MHSESIAVFQAIARAYRKSCLSISWDIRPNKRSRSHRRNAFFNTANAPTSKDWKTCDEWTERNTSQIVLFRHAYMNSSVVWLPWPLRISIRHWSGSVGFVLSINTSLSHFKAISLLVQPLADVSIAFSKDLSVGYTCEKLLPVPNSYPSITPNSSALYRCRAGISLMASKVKRLNNTSRKSSVAPLTRL